MKGSVKKVEPGGLLMGTSTYLPSTHQGQKKRGESKAGSFGQGPITSSMEKSYPSRASRHGILFFLKDSSIHLYLVSKGANWRNRDESAFRDNTVATLALERRLPRVLPER